MPWQLVGKTLADKNTLADDPPQTPAYMPWLLIDKTLADKYTLADDPPEQEHICLDY